MLARHLFCGRGIEIGALLRKFHVPRRAIVLYGSGWQPCVAGVAYSGPAAFCCSKIRTSVEDRLRTSWTRPRAHQSSFATQGLQLIGISMDDSPKPVGDFYSEYKINYPVAIGTGTSRRGVRWRSGTADYVPDRGVTAASLPSLRGRWR
jgi:hypothetical protein